MKVLNTIDSPVTRTGVRSPVGSLRILLADPDPYLAFLLRVHVPEAEVIQARSRADISRLLAGTDVLMLDVEHGSVPGVRRRSRAKVIGVADRTLGDVPAWMDGVLRRPFVPDELVRVVRQSSATASPASVVSPVDRARTWVGPGRIAAVGIGGAAELAVFELSPVRVAVLAAAVIYAALRLRDAGRGPFRALTDVAFAAATVTLTGGTGSPYIGFALLMCLEAGLVLGMGPGAVAASLVAAGSLPRIADAVGSGSTDARQLVAWLTLFPLTALAGGLVARMGRAGGTDRAALLAEANRVLGTLYGLARAIPDGLDREAIATSTMDQIRRTTRASAAVLLVHEAELLVVLEGFGLLPDAPAAVEIDNPAIGPLLAGGPAVVERDQLDGPAARLLSTHPCWIAAPLQRSGSSTGLLLAACADHARHEANRLFCGQLAEEAAVALENARLFADVRKLSVDEERRRLARELHDGVAQSLAYVRMELEYLGRRPARGADLAGEAQRLARVVDGALGDVRGSIHGLNAVGGEGLAGALRTFLGDLGRSCGPEIAYRERGVVELSPGVQNEVFRVAQEAVSNALRYAAPSIVTVTLEEHDGRLRLTVTDDGVGLRFGAPVGLGLVSMHERARRIGAELTFSGRPEGGTSIELVRTPAAKPPIPIIEEANVI